MFALFSLAIATEANAGVSGSVQFNFPYQGDKQDLFLKLQIIIKTPSGALVDQAAVQPTGFWVITPPSAHELVISVKAPDGLVINPPSLTTTFPFNQNLDFKIDGFSLEGTIVTKSATGDNVRVSVPLQVTATCAKTGTSISVTSRNDGTYSLGPANPETYTLYLKGAISDPVTVDVQSFTTQIPPLVITEWPQTGTVLFPDGMTPQALKLLVKGTSTSLTIDTDSNGEFYLRGLGVGQYQIKSADPQIAVSKLTFIVTAAPQAAPLQLKYEGINIRGNVKFPDGQPVPEVDLVLDRSTARSNDKGEFTFTAVLPSESPVLTATKLYHQFSLPTLSAIITAPVSPIAVVATHAPVSGFVECPQAMITFTGDFEPIKVETSNGKFRLSLPYGKEATISVASKCGFEQNELKVKVPASDILFQKVKSCLRSKVRCIGECNEAVKFTLGNNEENYQTSIKANGDVVFDNIEFGTYRLKFDSVRGAEWNVLVDEIVIDKMEVDIPMLAEQTALLFNVTSSHAIQVKCGDTKLSLKRGITSIRTYNSVVTSCDCHVFEPVNLMKTTRIIVQSVRRQFVIDGNSGDADLRILVDGQQLGDDFTFLQNTQESVSVTVQVKSPYLVEKNTFTLEPPADCDSANVKLDIVRGVEYTGKITPPISAVKIQAFDAENVEVASTETDADGKYSLGAFHPSKQMTLVAKHDGYRLINEGMDFTAKKLSELLIKVENVPNDASVIMSLSSVDGYHDTKACRNLSQPCTIHALQDGTYYLQPVLKEYRFEPASAKFEVEEGKTIETLFVAERIHFGISGEVKRVTGEPEPDIEIEAIFADGNRKTTITSASGSFRIGDIPPNQTITLYPRTQNTSSAQRVTPSQIKVRVERREMEGIRFLSLKKIEMNEIHGELDLSPDFLKKVSVVLMDGNNAIERFTFPSQLSNKFFFTNVPDGKYTIIVANLEHQSSEIECTQAEFDMAEPMRNLQLRCKIVQRELPQIQTNANPLMNSLVTIASIVVWVVFCNFSRIRDFLRYGFVKEKTN